MFDFSPQLMDKKQVQKALESEENLMSISGLKPHLDIHFFDVKIDHYGENFIHTCKLGDHNQIDMVILHGYTGAGMTFYRIVEPLSRMYRVFTVDFLGMGLSSRPKFDIIKTEEVIEFFVETLEKWRDAVGLDRFHLVGHSLGGYLACQYAKKYSKHIVKLSLISPAGITKLGPDDPTIDDILKEMNFMRRWFFKFFLGYWEKRKTPHSAYKSMGFIGRSFLKRFVEKRFNRPKNESKWMYRFLKNILLMPESSEKALHSLLKPPRASAFHPGEDFLSDLELEIDFYYGDRDWMCSKGARRLSEKTNGRFKVIQIKNAGHHINMDNPEDLIQNILRNAEKTVFLHHKTSKNASEEQIPSFKNRINVKSDNMDEISQRISDNDMGTIRT